MQMKVGHFEPDGAIVYLPIGFVPDLFLLVEVGATNPMIYIWFERQEDDEASGSQEGVQINGADGVVTLLGDAAGIIAYDAAANAPTIEEWTQARGNAATARTSTAAGTLIKGTVASGVIGDGSPVDRSAIFECVTAGTSAATEPVWPEEVGAQVVDSSVVWELVVDQPLKRVGYQGVTISATPQTNGQEMYYAAFEADRSKDHGDVDGWPSGVYQDIV